jgi:hypothetical protein
MTFVIIPASQRERSNYIFNGYGIRELSGWLGSSRKDSKDGRDFFGGYPKESVDGLQKSRLQKLFLFLSINCT